MELEDSILDDPEYLLGEDWDRGKEIESSENPEADIYLACRIGDKNRVSELIMCGVDINKRDMWDSVPLYYATLTGHIEIVKLLLSHGAICNEFTFDGDRCHYAALNMEIRNILDGADVCKIPPLNPLAKSIRALCSLCDDPEQVVKEIPDLEDTSDIILIIEDKKYYAHKVILTSRLPKINILINNAEKRSERIENKPFITFLPGIMTSTTLEYLLIYAYSERIDIDMDKVEEFQKVVKKFGCECLNKVIDKELTSIKYYFKALGKGRTPKRFVLYPKSYPTEISLEDSMKILRNKSKAIVANKCKDKSVSNSDHADILLNISGELFRAHKCVLCVRSEYFRKFISKNISLQFIEPTSKTTSSFKNMSLTLYEIPHLLPFPTDIVLDYIYTGNIPVLDQEYCENFDFVSNVFYAADFLLVFDAKKIFAEMILKQVKNPNVKLLCNLLLISDMYLVIVLRDFCLNQLALMFDSIYEDSEESKRKVIFERFVVDVSPKDFSDAETLFDSQRLKENFHGTLGNSTISGIGIGTILEDLREKYLEIFGKGKDLRDSYAKEFDKRFLNFAINARERWISK